MKRNLLSIAFAVTAVVSNAQSWQEQNSNFPNEFTGVDCISAPAPDVVWITGFDWSGSATTLTDISKTIDGGQTWVPYTVGQDTNYQFANICALDGNTAWAARFNQVSQNGGGIWKTTDGGVTWAQQDSGSIFNSNGFLDFLYFWDSNNGVAVGDPNGGYFEIYTTTDGGTNWNRVASADIPAPLTGGGGEFGLVNNYDVYGDTIWFNTDRGRLYKSVDKGLHWTVAGTILSLPNTQSMEVKFLDGQNGLASVIANGSGLHITSGVLRTTDGGQNWDTLSYTGNFMTNDFGRIPGAGIYMSVGILNTAGTTANKGSSYSLDSGATWVQVDTIQHTSFKSYDINNTWTGGANFFDMSLNNISGMYHFVPGTLLSVRDAGASSAEVNVYPNPGSGFIKLDFKVARNSDVLISVNDLLGNELFTAKFSNVTVFRHAFDFSDLPKGVYVMNLEYSGTRTSEKLVIQ